jgi:NTP pyrophosphatase (non-canonical NTP hydrolase)
MDDSRDLVELSSRIARFAEAREWQRFHTPRNLVLALAGEVGELAAEFQWVEENEHLGSDHLNRVSDEIADVAIYLIRLAEILGVDLGEVISQKIDRNELRYPVENSRGSSAKYTSYE